mgnify:CR=1 FL=1
MTTGISPTWRTVLVPAVGAALIFSGKPAAAAPGDAGFLECPVAQKQVKNGAKPDAELFKKIIRCKKGEKAVKKGDEGAIKVDVASIQIGASRPWSYRQDSGNGRQMRK